ncbi:MAG TPA: class I SAM-dependent methyltransferase [Candidatus Nanoarchaeia archaeon]|nr:class I SAM-dependent methyltransferase [Candidatus Nanoarchaeia archaeon]
MSNLKVYSGIAHSWGQLTSPARPTKDELRIIKEYLKSIRDVSKKGKGMLILGATPEFRDIGHELGFNVTLIDINPKMVKAMRFLMKNKKRKENVVRANWLEMPLPEKSFDVVMGEQSVNIIKVKDYQRFLKQIRKVMKEDGILIMKTRVYVEDLGIKYPVRKYEQKKINMGELMVGLEQDAGRHGAKGIFKLRLKDVGDLLCRLHREEKISDKTYNAYQKSFAKLYSSALTLSILTKRRFDAIFKRYFRIEAVQYAKDILHRKIHPIYLASRKD